MPIPLDRFSVLANPILRCGDRMHTAGILVLRAEPFLLPDLPTRVTCVSPAHAAARVLAGGAPTEHSPALAHVEGATRSARAA